MGTIHPLKDFACSDYICTTLDVIGRVSSAAGLIIGSISSTKHLTLVTSSVTVKCSSVRWYCKKYVTFWGCTVALGYGVKELITFAIKRQYYYCINSVILTFQDKPNFSFFLSCLFQAFYYNTYMELLELKLFINKIGFKL